MFTIYGELTVLRVCVAFGKNVTRKQYFIGWLPLLFLFYYDPLSTLTRHEFIIRIVNILAAKVAISSTCMCARSMYVEDKATDHYVLFRYCNEHWLKSRYLIVF